MIWERISSWRWLALALFAALLPFELKTPIVALGPIVITNVEVFLYALIVWWIFGILRARRIHWTLAHTAVLTWVIIQLSAAILAPVEREAALKFALRSAGGAAVFFITAEWIRSQRGTAWIMTAIAIGAVVSAFAGIAEVQSNAVQSEMLIFKTQATLVGGQVRASGTFQYANTAAMYWEAALPIIVAVGVWWSLEQAQRRWLWRSVGVAASLIIGEAIILSASRAALVGAGIALGALIIADRIRATRLGMGRSAGISLLALGMLIGVQVITNPIFIARLRTESDDSWFRATIQPAQLEMNAAAGDMFTTTVIVTNGGVRTWPAGGVRPVNLSYHWIQPGSRRVLILDGARTALPRDLAPGEAAAVSAWVEVPPLTGTLLLQWDLVQEDVTWFSERGSAAADVLVHAIPAKQPQAVEIAPARGRLSNRSSPPRADLWRAGVQMWSSHPLLGIGPDNFRHVYGRYLGQAEFDERITANSWYVELLATTGLVGLLSWVLIPSALIVIVRRHWWALLPVDRVLVSGLGAALLVFFLHGVVDYFMEFTPTYGLFWLLAGLLVGLLTGTHDVEFAGTADRI